jgi:hypothetical protein
VKRRKGLLDEQMTYPQEYNEGLLARQPINPQNYANLTSDNKNLSVDFKPLNFEALLKAKVFRVTNQGNQEGTFNTDPAVGFSLVSAYNDQIGDGEGTASWPDNPKFYSVVKNMFETRPTDIGAHKYLQIVQSARDLGIPESSIFLQKKKDLIDEEELMRSGLLGR